MPLPPSDDETDLRLLIGTETVRRGRAYARAGAVRSSTWNGAGTVGYAHVRGSASRPYVVTVAITRSGGGQLTGVKGTCSCPMQYNCKHVAAVLLSDSARVAGAAAGTGAATAGARPVAVVAPVTPGWEQVLRSALSSSLNAPAAPSTTIALQFTFSAPPVTPGQPGGAVRIRPMLLGASGRWVKTGISWQNLGPLRYSSDTRSRQQAALLGEIVAMLSAGQLYYYGSPDTVTLQTLSRRIWPLLADCQAAGVALIGAERDSPPVVLHDEVARAGWDVSRIGADLHLQPVLTVGELDVPLRGAVALGEPAHGLAWLADLPAAGSAGTPAAAAPARALHLAQVAGTTLDLATLMTTPALTVAAADEARFLSTYYPLLRRATELMSRDGSVQLPELLPARLHLTVRYEPRHETSLSWTWGQGEHDGDDGRPLWPADHEGTFRDVAEERRILTAVAQVLTHDRDQLLEPAGLEWAPLAKSSLTGMATVRFVQDTLPALAALSALDISVVGEPAAYSESGEAPLVRFNSEPQETHDWFDLAVTVTIDGQDVPFRSLFLALAQQQEFLILASGTYFRLDRPELAQLAALITESEDLTDAPLGVIRVHHSQASYWDELAEVGELDAAASTFRRAAQALLGSRRRKRPLPTGFTAQLRPYQREGFEWLAQLYSVGLGGVLADEMGLGKTLQVLALICHAVETKTAGGPFLVVAPTSVVSNWESECGRFAPGLRVVTIGETEKRRGEPLAALHARADVVVTSYALFRLEFEAYQDLEWAGLLLDEAQLVKNHMAKGHGCARMLKTPFKLAITGTPFENHLGELWALFAIVAPGLLSSIQQFEQHYRWPIERTPDSPRLAALQRRTGPLMLRRTKEKVLDDLPDKQEQVVELELLPAHRKMYQTHLHRERRKVLGLLGEMDKNRFEIFRSLTLLRQASLDPQLVDPRYANLPSTKLVAVTEQLAEIAESGHRVLVFSQFTRFLTRVRDRLDEQGIDHCYLDGKTRRRAEVISRFKTGDAPVFLISLKAGGFGLNLTEADFCIVLDPWWNPAAESQAVDRAHRIGQTKKVMVYRLVAKETIEQRVMELKEGKAQLFAGVMDGKEFRGGSLSASDVRALLA